MKIKKLLSGVLVAMMALSMPCETILAAENQAEELSQPAPLSADTSSIENYADNEEVVTYAHPSICTDYEWEVLRLTNKQRAANGVEPLSTFPVLQGVSDLRKAEQLELYSHTRPNGSRFSTSLTEAGISWNTCGENIAAGYGSPASVVNGWMNSDGHRSNILNSNFTQMGSGYIYSEQSANPLYTSYWVQVFTGTRRPTSISIDNPDSVIEISQADSLDSLGLVLNENNSIYGTMYTPIIEEMCTGYDPNNVGTVQTVQVSTYGLTATFKVKVAVPMTGLTLNKETMSLNKGGSETLTATVVPANTTEDKTLTWSSSNPAAATVENGKVTAVSNGSTTITVKTPNGKTASCAVEVKSPLSQITLSDTAVSLTKGSTKKLTVNYNPSDTTDSKTVTWSSSNSAVAAVSDGTITAVSGGQATITAKVGAKSASCEVTVSVPLNNISLNKTSTTINRGSSETLTVSYNPTDTTDNKTVTWKSSNTGIATVENGKITAVNNGTAAITATVGGKTATCNVTVLSPLQSITLNKTSLTLHKGNTDTLSVTYNPTDTTDSKTVTWSSSNPSAATVNNGKITAVKPGSTTITAKVGSKTAECTVTVDAPLTAITLDKSNCTLEKGKSTQLNVSYNPMDTTDNKNVTWTSGNTSIATVSGTGEVKAIAGGSTVITATVGNKIAKCNVTVTIPLTDITLDKTDVTLKNAETIVLQVTYNPADTTDSRNVTWTSSNPEVAEVSGGKVTAVKRGAATIKASVGAKTAECKVTVGSNPFSDVNSIDWFYDPVMYVYDYGYMTGMGGSDRFAPADNISRAQFACILHRMEGSPKTEYTDKFPDVQDKNFYTEAVLWANKNGILNGYSNGNFGPADNITREQIAAMMSNYAKYKKYDVSETNNLNGFPDKSKVSSFALDSVRWAVGAGLISGDKGNISPQGYASRAQCASIIMRFVEHYK
ncbi:MAG: Ig-like domain-containing protein [Lachnospiraceae bacterium]|nr:Ig-like domain-containing protein [Lachnospiraceae bacterium]MDD3616659.1 Ig-like domain-containing protein [Lachnospiraceae bacterium]